MEASPRADRRGALVAMDSQCSSSKSPTDSNRSRATEASHRTVVSLPNRQPSQALKRKIIPQDNSKSRDTVAARAQEPEPAVTVVRRRCLTVVSSSPAAMEPSSRAAVATVASSQAAVDTEDSSHRGLRMEERQRQEEPAATVERLLLVLALEAMARMLVPALVVTVSRMMHPSSPSSSFRNLTTKLLTERYVASLVPTMFGRSDLEMCDPQSAGGSGYGGASAGGSSYGGSASSGGSSYGGSAGGYGGVCLHEAACGQES